MYVYIYTVKPLNSGHFRGRAQVYCISHGMLVWRTRPFSSFQVKGREKDLAHQTRHVHAIDTKLFVPSPLGPKVWV